MSRDIQGGLRQPALSPSATEPASGLVPSGNDRAQFTPGPWAWFGNRSGGVYLATPDRGRRCIMGFRRYGMNGAQPTFCVGSIMRPASELVSFVVGDRTVRGFKQADGDTSVYRYDISDIDHPDARLIAAAPALLEALKTAIRVAGEARDEWDAAPSGMKAGKLLIALSGNLPGYRPDIDAMHAAISQATDSLRGGE